MVTSSKDARQGLLLIVHLTMYVEPAVPLKPDVALKAFTNVPPAPLTTFQLPVPIAGVFPARVTDVKPQTL